MVQKLYQYLQFLFWYSNILKILQPYHIGLNVTSIQHLCISNFAVLELETEKQRHVHVAIDHALCSCLSLVFSSIISCASASSPSLWTSLLLRGLNGGIFLKSNMHFLTLCHINKHTDSGTKEYDWVGHRLYISSCREIWWNTNLANVWAPT